MSALGQAFHSLVRRPVFALTAVATLAFGIATTTALFTVVDAVLIRALPYPHPDRLVAVYEASPAKKQATSLIAPVRLEDWNRLNQTFETLSGAYTESVTDTASAEPERLEGRRVAPRFFAVFGMEPLVGRTFTSDEEAFGGPGAAVIGEGLWTRRYGRSPSAIGQHLVIDGRHFAIVGVMPATFSAAPTDVWLPAQATPFLMQLREARFLGGVGRMKPGVTVEQANADLDRVQRGLGEAFPGTDRDWSTTVADLKDTRVADYRRPLGLVFGAMALLLTIAVANIAGLMLVQLRRREREIAVRTALGASRPQIMATVMRETGLIAAAGAILGAFAAAGLVDLFKTMFGTLPRLEEVGLDWRALTLAALVSAAAAIVCGLLPVWMVTRRGLVLGIISSDTRSVSGGRHRLQQLLVVSQIAISLLLVASAGMLLRSYANLARVDVGFNADNVITFRVGAAWDEDRVAIGRMQERLIAELQQRPGVQVAGIANFLPAGGATLRYQVAVSGLIGPDANGAMTVGTRLVSSGYLRALEVPLLSGEWCPDLRMDFKAPDTILVNRWFVDTFAAGQDLIGRDLRIQNSTNPSRIVGVVGNMAEDGSGAAMAPYVYVCSSAESWPDPHYVVRTHDRDALLREIRQIVRGVSPTRAVFGARTLEDVLRQSLEQPRLDAQLLAVFAAAAVLLAALGLYSLFMLLVAERRRELGVRLALGAEPAHLVGLVFGSAGRIVVVGALIGLALTIAASRILKTVLFGVSPLDVPTLTAAVGVLAAVALAAVAIPALRAARVDPVEVLRS